MYQNTFQAIFRAAGFPVSAYGHFLLTQAIVQDLRTISYVDQWKYLISNECFHVRMEDHSVFLFDESTVNHSFSFIHCPLDVISYREFLARKGLPCSKRNMSLHEEEYGLVMETAALPEAVMPIRYDKHLAGYQQGVHPCAHVHFGLGNSVRVAVRRYMTPISFVLLVMRQMYPDCWGRLTSNHEQLKLNRKTRLDLQMVPAQFWGDIDEIESYLV